MTQAAIKATRPVVKVKTQVTDPAEDSTERNAVDNVGPKTDYKWGSLHLAGQPNTNMTNVWALKWREKHFRAKIII